MKMKLKLLSTDLRKIACVIERNWIFKWKFLFCLYFRVYFVFFGMILIGLFVGKVSGIFMSLLGGVWVLDSTLKIQDILDIFHEIQIEFFLQNFPAKSSLKAQNFLPHPTLSKIHTNNPPKNSHKTSTWDDAWDLRQEVGDCRWKLF